MQTPEEIADYLIAFLDISNPTGGAREFIAEHIAAALRAERERCARIAQECDGPVKAAPWEMCDIIAARIRALP